MKKINILFLILILFSLFLSFYTYPLMPEKMASHWNANGDVNGYMSKFWSLALFPIVLIFFALLFYFVSRTEDTSKSSVLEHAQKSKKEINSKIAISDIPKIDPMKSNIKSFKKEFEIFVMILFLFFISLQLFVIAWNLGYIFNIGIIISVGLGILFFYTGVMLKKTKRNFFIGIRTPWTLSSDAVWEKTHKMGSIIFKIVGVMCFAGFFFGKFMIYFILIPIVSASIFIVVYSYYVYRNLSKKKI